MSITSIILTLLSAIVVLLAIIFEGKLKQENKNKISLKDFFKEVMKISLFGWILIVLMLILNAGNSFISYKNDKIKDSQYVNDTLRFRTIIDQLNTKKIYDSITIKQLEEIVKINGLKSDSIKLQVVDNAIKTLNEQRIAVERERENIYIHFTNEIKNNLQKIYINYNKKRILGFADSTFFTSARLDNTYIEKYSTISTNPTIINHLMETSELIKTVNQYANIIVEGNSKAEHKNTNINMFIKNVEKTEHLLLSIYARTKNLNSYKKYENLNFSTKEPKLNLNNLKITLYHDYNLKNNFKE